MTYGEAETLRQATVSEYGESALSWRARTLASLGRWLLTQSFKVRVVHAKSGIRMMALSMAVYAWAAHIETKRTIRRAQQARS